MDAENPGAPLSSGRGLEPIPSSVALRAPALARPYERRRLRARDGVTLECAVAIAGPNAPWVGLILPFAAPLNLAEPFLVALAAYNVITWESRLILAPHSGRVEPEGFGMDRHVADFEHLLSVHQIERLSVVGYCSGAGVALASVTRFPARSSQLILVNGEYLLFERDDCVTRLSRELDQLFRMASANALVAASVWRKLADVMATRLSAGPPELARPYSHPDYFHRYALNYIAYRETDFEALAAGVRTPTAVITGACDEVTNVSASRRISELIAGSRLFIEASGDHYELLRHDSGTLRHIRALLAQPEEA
jgi:pimeloyl-ACP methyl ester carboxylesterase